MRNAGVMIFAGAFIAAGLWGQGQVQNFDVILSGPMPMNPSYPGTFTVSEKGFSWVAKDENQAKLITHPKLIEWQELHKWACGTATDTKSKRSFTLSIDDLMASIRFEISKRPEVVDKYFMRYAEKKLVREKTDKACLLP